MKVETFGRLLKAGIASIAYCEGKTAPIIEEELGALALVSPASIQRYKAGHIPPEPRTIEILAEACIRRGHLNGEWFQQFLHVARYYATESLLNQLCPATPSRPRPPRAYENLPAPTYSQFVMREAAFAEVLDGLGKRSAAVVLVGLGGNGKTSLAREVAAQCLKEDGDPLRFDAAVWVSDKGRPGTTNLSIVLDEIARTLDYPGYTQYEHEEKRHEVEQLLRRQKALIVVDNFETITDGALLSWLLNMPEPSKALLTTREYRREFRRGGWPVELHGMCDAEARALVDERLRRLRIEKLVGDASQLDPLMAMTGGNPKAIEMALGLVKYERRPLQQVVDDLHTARGELFDDLFTRAWKLLDEAARRVLAVMTFFPASATGEALSVTADIQGFAFDRAVERLADLALLDVQQTNLVSKSRYTLHPLVRAFAAVQSSREPAFEQLARQRWVAWYRALSKAANRHWHNLTSLGLLDQETENGDAASQWALDSGDFESALKIGNILGYYYYVRGLWDKQETTGTMRIDAARKLKDRVAEGGVLLNKLRIRVNQDNWAEADEIVGRLLQILHEQSLPEPMDWSFRHGLGIYAFMKHDYAKAQELFEQNMRASQNKDKFVVNRNRNWLADSLYQRGELEAATRYFEQSLHESMEIDYQRSITFCQVKLAAIALDQHDYERAAQFLEASLSKAHLHEDRRDLALIYHTYARLHTLRGNVSAARISLTEAIDLFERLGMRRKLIEARQDLRRLEANEVPVI